MGDEVLKILYDLCVFFTTVLHLVHDAFEYCENDFLVDVQYGSSVVLPCFGEDEASFLLVPELDSLCFIGVVDHLLFDFIILKSVLFDSFDFTTDGNLVLFIDSFITYLVFLFFVSLIHISILDHLSCLQFGTCIITNLLR